MGSNAVPGLLQLMRTPEPRFRRFLVGLVQKLPTRLTTRFFGKLTVPDSRRTRWAAAESLGIIGVDARAAIPALGRVLRDPDQQFGFIAALSLAHIGTDSPAELIKAIRDASPVMRETVALYIGQQVEQARAEAGKKDAFGVFTSQVRIGNGTAPVLAELLKDPSPKVQNVASNNLQHLGTAAIAALVEAIEHGDTNSRVVAAQILGQIGQTTWAGARPLAKMAKSESTTDRLQAITALGAFYPPAMFAVNPLTNALTDPSPEVRLAAVIALQKLAVSANRVVGALPVSLRDSSPRVREEAARVVGFMGVAGEPFVPELKRLLEDEDEGVCKAAKEALARMGK
jgi:HEAT repeat protein